MQRFTWLFATVILSVVAPLLVQAQSLPLSNVATLRSEVATLQHNIQWKPCPEKAAVECATITVPVNYAEPKGATLELAVARAKALNPAARIGVLFGHPGAHASGIDDILKGIGAPAFERVRQRFDIVSLDPRGAGRTRPLSCDFDLPPLTGDGDAALQAFFDERARLIAAQCLDEGRDFVLSISGNTFARDIEQFRRALGEHQLSFLLSSNSGPVGAVYASLYPKRVRAMLLDSTVGPDFRDYNIDRPAEQEQAFEFALGRIDQICDRTASCPLHNTGVVAAFDTVHKRLQAQPFILPNGSQFTASQFGAAIKSALSNEKLWPLIVVALTNALAENYALFAQVPGQPSLDDGFTARYCNDYGTRRAAADYQPIVESIGETYRRFTSSPIMATFVSKCMAWPAADPPLIRDVQREVKTPIVLIGSEFDTDAPFSWTKRMAERLGMNDTVVRYAVGGHVLATRSNLPCIAGVIDAYLFDLKLPAERTVCPAAPFGAP